MNRKLLIVSPHFPPANTPDCQRIRMSLPYYKEFGWNPTILCIDSKYEPGVLDDQLSQTVPSDIEIIKTKAVKKSFTKLLGINSLYWRCLPYLYYSGTKLIQENNFDLIFISTTIFPSMILGKKMKERFGIPYVLDIQDPWLSNYKYNNPPGGKIKYFLSQLIARIYEPGVVKSANHIISVSPKYPEMLLKRYSNLVKNKFSVIPFGASENDFNLVKELKIKHNKFDPNDGFKHWVYIGRGGEDIYFSLKSFFGAISEDRKERPEIWENIRIHFIGTSYSDNTNTKKTIEPVAYEMGIGDLVDEQTIRISYLESLKLLIDSDLLLIFGSDDLSYSPSKIYPYLLSQKPLISIFHEDSHINKLLQEFGVDAMPTYNTRDNIDSLLSKIKNRLIYVTSKNETATSKINWSKFDNYKVRELTRAQCEIFNSCIS